VKETKTNKQERKERIKECRNNREYERCIPEYLGRESARERKIMTRFRCGNEERENRYWMEGEKRRCRKCYEERETIEHMWNGCGKMREREGKEQGEILKEDGRKIRWMKEIWQRRERIEERGEGLEFKRLFLEILGIVISYFVFQVENYYQTFFCIKNTETKIIKIYFLSSVVSL
jgi:hypothetical protein